jgi:hypothetical protein
MILHFGLDFDGPLVRPHTTAESGVLWLGPRGLLRWLEGQLACGGWASNTDYLRIEMYRQALVQHVSEATEPPFYAASFEADRFATAQVLLEHRDTLVLAGWAGTAALDVPPRLRTFSDVEMLYRAKCAAPDLRPQMQGEADRWSSVWPLLEEIELTLSEVWLYEPEAVLPTHLQRAIRTFQRKNTALRVAYRAPESQADGLLGRFQQHLTGQPLGDASDATTPNIALLRARNDSDLATFLAQTLAKNPNWRPCTLLPDANRVLEQAMTLEGLPALGIRPMSLARPALQVLKLAPAFLWQPIDVPKIMEFLTLPIKPFDWGLGLELARIMADRPGLNSDMWYAAVQRFKNSDNNSEIAKNQYDLWFSRYRTPIDQLAPKADAIRIFDFLHSWAMDQYESSTSKDAALLSLSAQAQRVAELLRALPEQRIGYLELERIVRTIYEPLPVSMSEAQVGHLPFVHASGALTHEVDELLWWNCVYRNDAPAADFWQPIERAWLEANNCAPERPQIASKRRLLARIKPVLYTKQRLWLAIPDQTEGADNVANLLLGDLEAVAVNLDALTYHIGQPADRDRLAALLQIPKATLESTLPHQRPRPQIEVPPLMVTPTEDRYLTPTNLDSLLYYPHRWYLKQQAGLNRTNVLSVTRDTTLLGNLAHRFFELLLQSKDLDAYEQADVSRWIEAQAPELLEKEGATLLSYGREPERKAFLNKVRQATWRLLNIIRTNGWTVEATEMDLLGQFAGLPIKGKADLVLRRDDEMAIVDLKWSGLNHRKALITNEEDLQLVLYAHLLPPVEAWPHTAYFIIEKGQMIARNRMAFKEALEAGGGQAAHHEACERILARMIQTFEWRLRQLSEGRLEVRTARNAMELDEIYGAQLLELLEMKTEDARWDDYRTLIEFMG